jgi:pimeloyl-ACP methyl ester carboxylesterase
MRRAALAASAVLLLAAAAAAALVRPDVPLAAVRARYAPEPPSRFLRLLGMDVHYRDEGPRGAPVVLLLHGMNGSLHTWDGWAERLADSLRVVRLDLPGYGVTGPAPDDDYRVAAYVRTVEAFLDALGIARPSVAGHSFGGEIAWRFALARPGRVDRLILIDPSGYWAGRAPGGAGVLARPAVRRALSLVGPRWLFSSSLRQAYGVPDRITPELVDRYWILGRRPGNREALLRRSAPTTRSRSTRSGACARRRC